MNRKNCTGTLLRCRRKSPRISPLPPAETSDAQAARKPSGKPLQKFYRAPVIRELLLLDSKFTRMRLQPASRQLDGMLTMQHFVIQHVGYYVFWHVGAVQRRIERDLIQRRIEDPQLTAPSPRAPANFRLRQLPLKILLIQPLKHLRQIITPAERRPDFSSCALFAQSLQLSPRCMRLRIPAVSLCEFLR